MEIVTERLLHKERKIKEKHGSETSDGMKAMFVNRQSKGKGPKCYQCGKVWTHQAKLSRTKLSKT